MDYDSIGLTHDVLGVGWSHNFEAALQTLPGGNIQLNWNTKKSNVFAPKSGATNNFACSDFPVIYDSLTLNSDGTYTLTEPSQRKLQFDSGGRLTEIINSHGQAIQLFYPSGSAYPTQILEAVSGKSLRLSYATRANLLTQVSDDSGRNVTFLYDSSNNLTNVTKSASPVSQAYTFDYDSVGHVLDEINPEGVKVFTDFYDQYGRVIAQADAIPGSQPAIFQYDESQTNLIVTTVTDRTGATNIYIHDTNYLLLRVTDGLGNTTSYGYDAFGNKIAATNALGQVQLFVYDSSGNQVSATDAAGKTTTFQYDAKNNLISLTNAVGSVATFEYDANNNLTNSLDFLSNLVSLAYDTNSLLIQSISPRRGISTFVHSAGLLTGLTDAASNTTELAYDAVGRVLAVTNADGFVTTNAYDLNDDLTATADGLGNLWQYSYDSAGRKLSATDPLGKTTFYAYNGNGDLIAATNALGGVTAYAYDPEDRLASVTDANGNTRTLVYDAAGRLISVADPLAHTNLFQYDAVGNLTATVDALGITNQVTTYDFRNQPILTQDALGNQTRMSYDVLQRLVKSVDALSRTNTLGYDALSRLTNSTDPLSLVTVQNFDADGNRTALINPKSALFGFQYDLASRLTNSFTPTGRTTSYALNGRSLVTQITQPSTAQTILTYDGAGRLTNSQDSAGTIAYGYDSKGRLLTVSENGRTLARQYDAMDRLAHFTDIAGNVIQYAYDPVGNLTNLIYPDGKQVAYAYDAANRLVSVTDWNGLQTSYFYDADNRATNIIHPNGATTASVYDAAGRLIQQQDTAGGNLIYQVNFAYDSAGQIVGETNEPAATPYLPTPVAMNYDGDNALISYGGQTVTNDANGNMIYGPLTNGFGSYSYDVRNRLTSAGGLSYAYDPGGNRVAITNGTCVKQFVVDQNAALSQVLMRIQNGVTNYYVYGAGLLYEVTQTATGRSILVHHYDYRGSTVALTDGNGNVTDRISYSPYGSITSRTGTNDTLFLFNGSYGVQTDANSLLYMRARFYNPTICRFLNADPVGFQGGLNYYVFANENPISLYDPFGLFSWDHFGKSVFEIASASFNFFLISGTISLTGGVAAPAIVGAAVGSGLLLTHGLYELGLAFDDKKGSEAEQFAEVLPSNLGQMALLPFGKQAEKLGGLINDVWDVKIISDEMQNARNLGIAISAIQNAQLGVNSVSMAVSAVNLSDSLSKPNCSKNH